MMAALGFPVAVLAIIPIGFAFVYKIKHTATGKLMPQDVLLQKALTPVLKFVIRTFNLKPRTRALTRRERISETVVGSIVLSLVALIAYFLEAKSGVFAFLAVAWVACVVTVWLVGKPNPNWPDETS
jgi:hypothetical protein